MPMSVDVELPNAAEPVWPTRCVKCAMADPTGRIRLVRRTTSAAGRVTGSWIFGRRVTIDAPACPACAAMITKQHRVRELIIWSAVICATIVVVMYLAKWGLMGSPIRKVYGLVGLAVLVGPYFVWDMVSARWFDVEVGGKVTSYQFRSPIAASFFRGANAHQVAGGGGGAGVGMGKDATRPKG